MSGGAFAFAEIKPFKIIGLNSPFWTLHSDILIATWIAMVCIFIGIIIGRYFLSKDINLFSAGYETVISLFIELCTGSFQKFEYRFFAFITSLFFFTFFSSVVGIIPFVHEATMDLNTTLALALTSFLYVTFHKIKAHGIGGYLREFIEPVFIFAPIHAVGELSKIASMSFRLFGNILGGSIILMMILQVFSHFKVPVMIIMATITSIKICSVLLSLKTKAPYVYKAVSIAFNALFLITWIQIFFGIVEGLIQSFVLTMLTTTYLSIGVQDDSSDHASHEQNTCREQENGTSS